ncbi:hypothetical protein WICMUC_002428 [Wickerhamomyces mucosus]|uniref:SCD domain-containing protein n=1 Tax=Wickerhamomyces mucosus TaxID=1378264 RepID=A0A9P8TDT9_9ASCO|nr:hypothetical protein WICMUC_002428 [Wickerhamomyces mucosus]
MTAFNSVDIPLRRSRRVIDRSSSQAVSVDDSINNSKYTEDRDHDDDEEESDNDDDEDVEDLNDDDYGKTSTPKKRKQFKTSGSQRKKKLKNNEFKSSKQPATFDELRQEFEDNYLFQALNDSEISILELSTDWVDQYKSNKNSALKDLINLILNSVGSFTQIEEHDVVNNESANETIGEIQTFFKRQKIHEFYLISKKPEFKHLKKNFINFISQIINISDENGILYNNIKFEEKDEKEEEEEEESNNNIVEDLLIWLSSLSVSSIRALRYISTLSLYTIETTLCKIIKKNNSSLELFKRQLNLESSKKSNKTIKARIIQINSNIEIFTNQSSILDNFIQDVLNTTFIHRFKDIDHLIRVESMQSLGEWIDLYPEFFYRVTYLKYLGWVLSDENSHVRIQVLKTLIKILKNNETITGLRQFLERFIERIIEIAKFDIDINVRLNSINLLIEINKIGFLEDDDIEKIISLIYNEDKKLQLPLINFLSNVEIDKTKDLIDPSKFKNLNGNLPFHIEKILKFISLIQLLKNSKFDDENPIIAISDLSKITKIGQLLFNLSRYSNDWEDLIKYFINDLSSIEISNLLEILNLETNERYILIQLIYGNILNLISNRDKNEDDLQIFIKNSLSIYNKVENNELNLSIFIEIFNNFSSKDFVNDMNIYNDLLDKILKFFKLNSINSLNLQFLKFFKNLKKNYQNSQIIDVLNELKIQFVKTLNNNGNNNNEEVHDLKHLNDDFIIKFLIIGQVYDINSILNDYPLIHKLLLGRDIDRNEESYIISIYKLILSSISWRLNNLLNSKDSYDIEKELKDIPNLILEFNDLIKSNKEIVSNKFKTDLSIIYIDLFTILTNFYNKDSSNISNLNRFKEIELNSFKIDNSIINNFLNLFLIKEFNYFKFIQQDINQELDRDDEENLIFLSQNDNEPLELTPSNKWIYEKDLILYVSKLINLYKLELIPLNFIDRLKLNSNKLGELYQSILETEELEIESENDEIVEDDIIDEVNNDQNNDNEINNDDNNNNNNDNEIEEDEDDIPDIQMED